jgi:lactoylglutathione lyase
MFLGIRTIAYRVPDIKEGKDWYSTVFGTKPYFDEPFYVGFNIGGYELGLQPYEGDEIIPGNSTTAYWGVENVDEALKKMIDAGAVQFEAPMEVGGGVIVASVRDPWGNIVGVIYNPHFAIPD